MSKKLEKGFTLVELVIVIAIVGILAAIAIPRFIDIRDEAYLAARDGVIGSVRAGIMLVAARNQTLKQQSQPTQFPPNIEADWGIQGGGGTVGPDGTACDVNSCFELVITGGVDDPLWEQTTATTYTYNPPTSGPVIYTYTQLDGTFR